VTLVIGQGISEYCQENGLEPVTSEWVEKLGQSTQAKVWTKQGLVIASPDSGTWQVIGPFGQAG
jgi:hypothetical protein